MADQGEASLAGDQVGRLLAYADSDNAPLVAALTSTHQYSGIVVRGVRATAALRALPLDHRRQPIVADVAAWSSVVATPSSPLHLPPSESAMFPVSLDEWASGIAKAGASVVLTPSGFVRAGDWPSLRALLAACATSERDDVVTHVVVGAEMLSKQCRPVFLRILDEHAGGRPLAFTFAAAGAPIASREKARGLREVVEAHPGSLLVGTDALAGCDAAARGVSAAIGITGSLRQPSPPGTRRRGGSANGFVPGLFLRDLWEFRSPPTYADWYANSASPTCTWCGGRALDRFTTHPADKQAVLLHNVHAWLAVLDELASRSPLEAQTWLDADRRRALAEHPRLRPGSGGLQADALLRALCEIDDLQGRRTALNGRWL